MNQNVAPNFVKIMLIFTVLLQCGKISAPTETRIFLGISFPLRRQWTHLNFPINGLCERLAVSMAATI